MQDLSPHLDETLVYHRSVIIAGIIEGMMLMVGSGPTEVDARKTLLSESRKQIFRIATEP